MNALIYVDIDQDINSGGKMQNPFYISPNKCPGLCLHRPNLDDLDPRAFIQGENQVANMTIVKSNQSNQIVTGHNINNRKLSFLQI